MIITRITAGMGNQMFMYAAGLSLSRRLNTELKLDLQGFTSGSFRKYSLNIFPNITESPATLREIWAIAPFMAVADYFHVRGNSIFRHPFRRLLYEAMSRSGLLESGRAEHRKRLPGSGRAPIPFSSVYFPPDFSYPEEFGQIQDNTYITGHWESEKFFAGISGLIRHKFTFPSKYFNSELSAEIKACNSTAVHVWLGDKAAASESHISQIVSYLKSALRKIEELSDSPKFFVFSDDVDWCRKNLPVIHEAEYTFVGGGKGGHIPSQDMALMTQCKNVITGPSTFSWWGAWLNDNSGKIIITPSVDIWSSHTEDRLDLLPNEWIKIGD